MASRALRAMDLFENYDLIIMSFALHNHRRINSKKTRSDPTSVIYFILSNMRKGTDRLTFFSEDRKRKTCSNR